MKTTYRIRQPYADTFLQCAKDAPCKSPVKPLNFIRKMKMNQGSMGIMNGMGMDAQGLERRNPVIAALGDSVTAGHFEMLMLDPPNMNEIMERAHARMQLLKELGPEGVNAAFDSGEIKANPPVEITDARVCYLEQFRGMLIDQFETTSVCTINAGIAGDNLVSMIRRADRDIIACQPDLVLINGSLNWHPDLGTTAEYKEMLRGLVRRIREKTEADVVLMTPNGDLPMPGMPQPEGFTTYDRVCAIRELAEEEQTCLADTYAVWEMAREAGCPWEELLANRVNHPSAEGHTVYAITLMKLME